MMRRLALAMLSLGAASSPAVARGDTLPGGRPYIQHQHVVSPGIVWGWTWGRSTAYGAGLDLSYAYFPDGFRSHGARGTGGYVQILSFKPTDGDMGGALGVGAGALHSTGGWYGGGATAGLSYRSESHRCEATGSVVAGPFGWFGIAYAALTIAAPLTELGGSGGHGWQFALTTGVKVPSAFFGNSAE